MASRQQIAANRNNARLSTGPRTEDGRSAVRGNALKSGIYANRETVLPSEDPTALSALAGEYFEQHNPRTPAQRCLVDSLVSDEWLLRRFRRIEGELLTSACQDVEGRAAERFAIGDAYEQNSATLERLQRRINAIRKSYLKTLETLIELQTAEEAIRQAQRDEVAALRAAAQFIENPTASPQIGFVPSNSPEDLPKPAAILLPPLHPPAPAPPAYVG